MVPRRFRRGFRRRRKEAIPIQTGLVLFAASILAVLAFANRKADLGEGEEVGLFNFRLRRQLQTTGDNLACEGGSGDQLGLRWDRFWPFTEDQAKSGAIIFHILVLLYMFTGLAIICDDYFCSALDEICVKLDISDDVAGATFMAAGGSAPEFFTSLLGVFFLDSADVGTGTVVGSAVFNVLFVIGICAYFSGFDTLPLTWYPLARDSSYYLLCLGMLLGLSSDYDICWYDALILFLMYLGYVAMMMFDPPLRKWAMKNFDRSKAPQPHRPTSNNQVVPDANGADATSKTSGKNSSDTVDKPKAAADVEGGKEEEEEEEEPHDGPPEWPESPKEQIIYIINAPLNWGMYLTIPDCRVERFKKWYMLTFWLSVLWIGGLSYVMVLMAEDIGKTIGLSDAVMGVSVLAVGTSVPDAVSSLLVARDGHGDMALSSSIGSNVFDVTFGLPVPWFIKTAFIEISSGCTVKLTGNGISTLIATLMFMVFCVVLTIHLYGWKISKPLGLCYFALYFVFVTEAIIFATVDGLDGVP